MRFEGRAKETKLSSESKKSTPDKTSPNPLIEDVDLDVTIPSKDKSPRSAGKQESLISDVTSIQENSSIESVLDDSMISSKSSLSRSKTSGGNSSSDKSSRREEKARTIAKYEKGRGSDKSSEVSRGKASPGNSSIAKRSLQKSSEKTSKAIVKIPKAAIDRNSDPSRSSRDDSVIEESIDTVDNGSEILSELSRIKKTDDSIKNSFKYSAAKNAISNQLAIESGYANDTFEDVSSSTMRSIIDEKKKIDSPESSVKKIDTALFVQYKYHQKKKSNG